MHQSISSDTVINLVQKLTAAGKTVDASMINSLAVLLGVPFGALTRLLRTLTAENKLTHSEGVFSIT